MSTVYDNNEFYKERSLRREKLKVAIDNNDINTIVDLYMNNRVAVNFNYYASIEYHECISLNDFFIATIEKSNLNILKQMYDKFSSILKSPINLGFLLMQSISKCNPEFISYVFSKTLYLYPKTYDVIKAGFKTENPEIIELCLNKMNLTTKELYALSYDMKVDDFSILLDKYFENYSDSIGISIMTNLLYPDKSMFALKVFKQLFDNSDSITEKTLMTLIKLYDFDMLEYFMDNTFLLRSRHSLTCYLKRDNRVHFKITRHFISFLLHSYPNGKIDIMTEEVLIWFAKANYTINPYALVNLIGYKELNNYIVGVLHMHNFDPDQFCTFYINKLYGNKVVSPNYLHHISDKHFDRLRNVKFECETDKFCEAYRYKLIIIKKKNRDVIDDSLKNFIGSRDVNNLIADYVGFVPYILED